MKAPKLEEHKAEILARLQAVPRKPNELVLLTPFDVSLTFLPMPNVISVDKRIDVYNRNQNQALEVHFQQDGRTRIVNVYFSHWLTFYQRVKRMVQTITEWEMPVYIGVIDSTDTFIDVIPVDYIEYTRHVNPNDFLPPFSTAFKDCEFSRLEVYYVETKNDIKEPVVFGQLVANEFTTLLRYKNENVVEHATRRSRYRDLRRSYHNKPMR